MREIFLFLLIMPQRRAFIFFLNPSARIDPGQEGFMLLAHIHTSFNLTNKCIPFCGGTYSSAKDSFVLFQGFEIQNYLLYVSED